MNSQTYKNTTEDYFEELVQCPYNPSHRVRPGTRMQRHLLKCRKNHLEDATLPGHQRAIRMKICKYNSEHHVLQEELDQHHKACEDKKVVLEMAMTQNEIVDEPLWKRNNHIQPQVEDNQNFDDDNWDEDVDEQYNPMDKVLQSKGDILFNPQNKTRSHKRTFRQNQRMLKNQAYGDKEEEYVYMLYEDRKTGAAAEVDDAAVDGAVGARNVHKNPPPSVWGKNQVTDNNPTAAAGNNEPLGRPGSGDAGAASRPPPGFGRGFGRGRGTFVNNDNDDLAERFSGAMGGVMKVDDDDDEFPSLGGVGRGRGRGRGKKN